MKKYSYFPGLLAALLMASSASGDLIKPVSVTSNVAGDAGSAANYLLDDNPGAADFSLQDEFGDEASLVTGDTIAKALSTYAFRAGSAHSESWTFGTGGGNPVFVFDLSGGGDISVGSALLWQYGNNGGDGAYNCGNSTREFSLIFHTEAEGSDFDFDAETADYSETMDPIYGDATVDNVAQPYFFGTQQTARYVALRIDSNYAPPVDPIITLGGDRYGLGEVRFATEHVVDPRIETPTSITLENNGGTEVFPVLISNSGTSEDLSVTGVTFSGLDAASFTLITDLSAPLVISPGSSAELQVELDPSSIPAGVAIEADIDIASNGWFTPTVSVSVGGVIRDPWIDSESTVAIGPFLPDSGSVAFTVDIDNRGGSQSLVINDGFLATDFEFTLVDDLLETNLVIAPGETGQLNLSFDPLGAAGTFNDTLSLSSNDSAVAVWTIELSATVERDPEISVPPVFTVGPLATDSGPHTFSVPVSNLGLNNPLLLKSDPLILDGDEANFSLDSYTASIAPEGSGSVDLTFNSEGKAGSFTTTLDIESNDLGSEFTQVQIQVNVDPAPAPGNLVGWWSFDDVADPGKDNSGNGFDGFTNGAPTFANGANANTGNALSFDGSAGIDVPWTSYLNPESFTVTLWASPTTTAGHNSAITSRDDAPNGTFGYILYNDPTGIWSFWTGNGNPGWETLAGGTVAINSWQHIAFSYDAATQTKSIYQNGVLINTATGANIYAPNGPQTEELHLAGGGDTGSEFLFSGELDDIAVFGSALSLDDINTVMNQGVSGFLNAPPSNDMRLSAGSYDSETGMLGITATGVPAEGVFHLRGSTDGQAFSLLDPPVDFTAGTAMPMMIPVDPANVPVLLIRAEDGPSNP